MAKANHVIAIVGMCGSGKSTVSDFLIQHHYGYLRFGQLTIDEIKKRGLVQNADNERMIREELRTKHGMAAFAILNLPAIERMIEKESLVIDGLYSWSEYKYLKDIFGKQFIVIAVYAPPSIRYERLENRASKYLNDTANKFRSISNKDAMKRDYAEIENLEKGGPIAMADFTIANTKTEEDVIIQLKEVLTCIAK